MGEAPSNWYLCENWQKYSDAINAVDSQVREDLCRRFGDFLDNKEAQKLARTMNLRRRGQQKKFAVKEKTSYVVINVGVKVNFKNVHRWMT